MKFAVVRRDGWDEVLVSMHRTRAVAEAKALDFNGGWVTGPFSVLDLDHHEIIDLFGRKIARPKGGAL